MRLSVITPVAAGRAAWLAHTAASVHASRTLLTDTGIGVEWVLCCDGDPIDNLELPADRQPDRIVGWRTRRGVSAARNAALATATGDWVVPVDADDELEPAGLRAAALAVLQAPAPLGWVGCNRLLTDGSRTPHWSDQARRYAPGELAQHWTSPFPFHPNSVLLDRHALLRTGGWPSLGVNEDLAAVLLVSEDSPGRTETAVLTRYRTWDRQEVASDTYQADKTTAFGVIAALLNSRRHAAGRPLIQPPVAGPAHGRIRTSTPPQPEGRSPS